MSRVGLALLLLLAAAHPFAVASDPAPDELRRQIDDDVWRPFLAASSSFDAEGFLAVQSPDLVRISEATGEIHGLDHYAASISQGFRRVRERGGVTRTTEARFLARSASANLAHEAGYFRSTTVRDGQTRVAYTRFDFVLRRENGRWKILVDRDSPHRLSSGEAQPITEADFLAAQPLLAISP